MEEKPLMTSPARWKQETEAGDDGKGGLIKENSSQQDRRGMEGTQLI